MDRTITIPPTMAALLDDLVAAVAKRNNETPDDVRRGVELSILARGVQALQAELAADGETVGEVPAQAGE